MGDKNLIVPVLQSADHVKRFALRDSAKLVKNKLGENLVVAEVGVQDGYNARTMLIEMGIKRLYLVDPYDMQFKGIPSDYESHKEHYTNMFNNVREFFNKVTIVTQPSDFASGLFTDGFFDWVYIDANHDYASVKNDLNSWYSKVRFGGILSGHDRGDAEVDQAFQDFAKENSLPLAQLHDDWVIEK